MSRSDKNGPVGDRGVDAAPQLVDLPEISAPERDVAGKIVVLEHAYILPFTVHRTYWIHGMRKGEKRGGHAHRSLSQAIIAVTGGAEVELDDRSERTNYVLDRPDRCLIVPPGRWRDIVALSDGSAIVILASEPYREDDYIRSYDDFIGEA